MGDFWGHIYYILNSTFNACGTELPVDHQVSEALELAVAEPGVAAKVQMLQRVEGKEGFVAHAPQQVVRQVDLLHVALRQVLEGDPVHLHQLV